MSRLRRTPYTMWKKMYENPQDAIVIPAKYLVPSNWKGYDPEETRVFKVHRKSHNHRTEHDAQGEDPVVHIEITVREGT